MHLLGLFPHPDDEAYAAGGTMASCSRTGAKITVAVATRGEGGEHRRGEVGPGRDLDPGRDLALLRTAELERSCEVLGADRPVFFDLPDTRIGDADREAVVAKIVTLFEERRPDVIVTLGRDGVYGNRDHLAWTELVTLAVDRCAAVRSSRLLYAAFPRGLFEPVWRSLRRRPGAPLSVALDSSTLGMERGAVDLRVDISGVRDRKLAAIAAHGSQLVGGDPCSFLWPGLIERLLDEEWFTLAAGPPFPPAAMGPFAGLASAR